MKEKDYLPIVQRASLEDYIETYVDYFNRTNSENCFCNSVISIFDKKYEIRDDGKSATIEIDCINLETGEKTKRMIGVKYMDHGWWNSPKVWVEKQS